jgi:CubicO group peptidase (beta-lactamase class C family)
MGKQGSTTYFAVLLALLALVSCTDIKIGTKKGGSQTSLPSSTPEKQGMDSTTLVKLLEYIEEQDKSIDSLLVIRNGHIILEVYYYPYTRDKKHILNSCTKSFVSGLVGITIDKGHIKDENSNVLDFFLEYGSTNNDPLKGKIEIKHLLTMTSGIDWPQYGSNNISDQMGKSNDGVKFIFNRPMAAEPGSQSNYSNGDAHLLSAIIQKTTGETALDFGWKYFFQPLGISDVRWDYDPQGINIGSATMYLTPRNMAKLGYLYLNDGTWEGERIVSADWVRKSLQSHTRIQIAGGFADYGYYWWIYPELGLYEAWGGAGQRIAIFPELGIVTVMTSDIPDDAPVTPFSSAIYHYIVEAAKSPAALPENPKASAELGRQIATVAQPKQGNLLLIGLASAVFVIMIVGVVVWRKRRNKTYHHVPDSL